MKMKSLVLLAFAGTCGLVAMLGVQQMLSADKPEEKQTVQVLVATVDIPPGVRLDETNTKFKEWAADSVPEGAVKTPEEYQERALMVRAVAGEVIMAAKLGAKGAIGASLEIPDGMRVVTVPVDTTMSHSGLLLPGDHVDILVTYKGRTGNMGITQKTKLLLQYIQVFAADSIRDAHDQETPQIAAKNISFLVTPQQGALLMLGKNKGSLHLALRKHGDKADAEIEEVSEDFFEGDTGKAPAIERTGDPQEGNVRDQLIAQQHRVEPTANTEPTVPDTPVAPSWTIQIYEGDQLREERVQQQETDLTEEEKRQAGFFKKPAATNLPLPAAQPATEQTTEMKQMEQLTQELNEVDLTELTDKQKSGTSSEENGKEIRSMLKDLLKNQKTTAP